MESIRPYKVVHLLMEALWLILQPETIPLQRNRERSSTNGTEEAQY